MRLPRTLFPVAVAPVMTTPKPELFAITFPSPAAAPPIALIGCPLFSMPWPLFPSAVVPSAATPIRLPLMTFCMPAAARKMPSPLLPEMTFPCPGPAPPTVVFDALTSMIPRLEFPRATEPVLSVPT